MVPFPLLSNVTARVLARALAFVYVAVPDDATAAFPYAAGSVPLGFVVWIGCRWGVPLRPPWDLTGVVTSSRGYVLTVCGLVIPGGIN